MTFTAILKALLYLQWKQIARSSFFRLTLIARLFAFVMGLYLLLNFIFIGYILDVIIKNIHPEQEPTRLINQYVVYFYGIVFVVRILIQKLPSTQLSICLHLPFTKSKLVLSYLSIYLLRFLNHIPMVVVTPYWLKVVLPEYSLQSSMLWVIGFCLIAYTLNFMVLKAKIMIVNRTGRFAALAVLLTGGVWLDHNGETKLLASASGWLFDGLLDGAVVFLVLPLVLLLWAATSTFLTLRRHLYLDHGSAQNRKMPQAIRTGHIAASRPLSSLISLEWKLLSRNKVTRCLLIAGLIYLTFGLVMIVTASHHGFLNPGMGIFCLLPLGGFVIFPYSVSLFSSEGRFFDGILSRNIKLAHHVDTKLAVLSIAGLVICALNLALFHWTSEILRWLLVVLFLYVFGVAVPTAVYHTCYNTKLLKINGSLWEMSVIQGKTFHYIVRLLLIYYPAALLYFVYEDQITMDNRFFPVMGLIGIPGLLSLMMISFWRRAIVNKLKERKYVMAEGFRRK